LSLFYRAARSFERALNDDGEGANVEVEIMTLQEFSHRYNDGVIVTKHDLLDLMHSGRIQMSQMYTTWLAEKYSADMHVLDLPFLFRDHDHAQRVLEGEVGQGLLAGLSLKSKVQGLAFTYSGGFRMIPAKKAIRTIEDFQGLSLRSNKNPFAMETLKCVGAVPIPCELEEINDGVRRGDFIGGESAWPRVYPLAQNEVSTAMNDTRHSLFLTSMIVQSEFWQSLSPALQRRMRAAAVQAAREERAEAIRDGERAKEMAKAEGIEIVELSAGETEKFKLATRAVYEKFQDFFSPGLVNRIRTQ